MYLVIKQCVTAVKVSNFSGHYLRNRSTLDKGVLGYIGIVQHKEHSPEVLHIPPGTPCRTLPSIYLRFVRPNIKMFPEPSSLLPVTPRIIVLIPLGKAA